MTHIIAKFEAHSAFSHSNFYTASLWGRSKAS